MIINSDMLNDEDSDCQIKTSGKSRKSRKDRQKTKDSPKERSGQVEVLDC